MANYPYRDLGIMLDLDNWQKLNDNFGDVATDLQLQKADYDAKLSSQQGEYNGKFGEVNARIDGIKQEISGEVLAEVIADASLIRQTPVDTFADLATVYPTPETGWAAMTRDTGKVYRYNGTEWLEVEDIDPTAINEVDTRLSTQLADIVYNVKLFYVEGEANYSAAFQRANDALAAVGGGTLYVPRGTYFANFILDSNINLKGDGVNVTIIKSVAGSNLDVVKGRDFDTFTNTTADVTTQGVRFIGIQDLTIDGNKANNTSGYGIRIWGCFWYFNNVVVQYCADDGIWTEFTSILSPTEATARTAALESMFRNIKVLYCDGNAWSFNGPHDSIIDNYVAIGNLGWALYQRNFNSFLTGENWNVWKNGNGFHVGTGIAGHSLIADNDGTGIGMEFEAATGNSRIVNSRLSGWDKGMILKGQSHNIRMHIQNCGLLADGAAIVVDGLSLTHLDIIAQNNNCVLDMVSEISKNSFVVTASIPSGKVLQRGVAIRSDSFALLNSGGTGMMQLAENSLKVKGWTFTFPTNNGKILTTSSTPTTSERGGIITQNAVPNVAAAPTAAEFNTLLSRLRAAGIIAN